MPTIEELQEQIEALKSEAAAHRKGKAEEKRAREEVEAKLAEIDRKNKDTEEKLLKEQGNVEEILARKQKEWDAQFEKVKIDREQWQKRYESKAIDEALVAAASKGNAHDPSEIASLLRSSVALDEQGNVFIKAGDGVMTDNKGERVTVDAYVTQWLGTKPHHVKPIGGGAGSQGGRESSSAATVGRAAFEAMGAAEKVSFVKGGGKVTD